MEVLSVRIPETPRPPIVMNSQFFDQDGKRTCLKGATQNGASTRATERILANSQLLFAPMVSGRTTEFWWGYWEQLGNIFSMAW